MSNPNFVYMINPVFEGERICISRSAVARYRREGWTPDKVQFKKKAEPKPLGRPKKADSEPSE